jgi:hypothetical protein
VDELLSDNQRQPERALDLFLEGTFTRELLTERKQRLETTITSLEKERADLVTRLEAESLTNEQVVTITGFAEKIAQGLEEADVKFEARRWIIERLDVQAILAVEGERKIACAQCILGEGVLHVESTGSKRGRDPAEPRPAVG